jgi:hypothetical protein
MDVVARPTAVVGTATTWQQFPIVWKELLDEVWACLLDGERVSGTRWEVYGPHNDDIAQIWTEIYWLLA